MAELQVLREESQIEAQRSGFDLERSGDRMSEKRRLDETVDANDMPSAAIWSDWLDRAAGLIRFGPDRAEVRAELRAHLEDKTADLRRIFPDMTVLENLKIGAYLRKDDLSEDLEWVYSLFPRLKERSWQAGGTLSGGEQQMLAVGRALMSRPKLLMMDEPSLGLAPLVVQGIFDIIRTINQQGVTVLLIEQNANMALKVADRAYVLETGLITKTGTGAELLADESIKEAYLGKKKAH